MPLVTAANVSAPFETIEFEEPHPRTLLWSDTTVSDAVRQLTRLWARSRSAAVQDASFERLELVRQLFLIFDIARVEAFLRQHVQVIEALFELHSRAEDVFGLDVPMSLHLLDDPDAEDETPELFVIAHTSGPLESKLESLAELDDRWWRDASATTDGLLNVDVDLG